MSENWNDIEGLPKAADPSTIVETPAVTPVAESPKIEAKVPKVEAPEMEFVRREFPKMEFTKVEPPKMEMPRVEATQVSPKAVTPESGARATTPRVSTASEVGEVTTTPRVSAASEVGEATATPRVSAASEVGEATATSRVSATSETGKIATTPGASTAPGYTAPQTRTYETYQFSQGTPATPKSSATPKNVAKPKSSKAKAKKEKMGTARKFGLCVALALVFGLVAGAVFQGVNMLGRHYLGEQPQENVAMIPEATTTVGSVDEGVTFAPEVTASTGSVAQVAEKVMPSVVAISNIAVQEVPSFFGGGQSYENESSGSGIIVGQNETELLVATNNHVVAGATTITVTFIDGNSVEAQIKGADSDNDLAVVAVKTADIQESTLGAIKVATIGDSDKLKVGEQVVAIGNALGYGQSVTSGYVSALDREVDVDETYTAKLIQTDAAINPGNSGGALLNMEGELIGINAVKFAANGVEGMGYAIPISTAQPILGELMNRTTRYKVEVDKASYLGVSCRAVTAETAEMYSMPIGVFVAEVTEGGPAAKAGIQKGDIIVKFDGQSVKTYDELVDALTYYEAGETVDVTIARAEAGEYQEQTNPVVLESRPADLDAQNRQGGNQGNNSYGEEGGNFQLPW